MADTVLGLEAKIYYRSAGSFGSPTWTEGTIVKDVTQTLTKAQFDASRRGSKWRRKRGTLRDAPLEFEILYKPGDSFYNALRDAWLNDTTIDLAALSGDITTPGSEGIRAEFEVFEFSRKEPLEGGLTVSVKCEPGGGDNEPEWMEVT